MTASASQQPSVTLADLREGQSARVRAIRGAGPLKRRLMEMGITKGALLRVERYAPLADPVEILVKGYALALRVQEARHIEVEGLSP